jgi:hypothetical protein
MLNSEPEPLQQIAGQRSGKTHRQKMQKTYVLSNFLHCFKGGALGQMKWSRHEQN